MYRDDDPETRRCPQCRLMMRRATVQIKARSEVVDVCEHCAAYYFDFADGRPAELAYFLSKEPLLPSSASNTELRGGSCPDCSKPLELIPKVASAFRCPTHCSVFVHQTALRQLAGLPAK